MHGGKYEHMLSDLISYSFSILKKNQQVGVVQAYYHNTKAGESMFGA